MLGILFAQANNDVVNRLEEISSDHRFSTTDLLMVASAAGVVAIALLIWAVFFRKRRDNHDHPDFPRPDKSGQMPGHGRSPGHKHKRRRRRRQHRPRNPTLKQAGGLPDMRPEDQPPPS